jgi:type VI secretion system protein ImpI
LHAYAIDGASQGERTLTTLPIRIGRNALNDFVVPHNYVSDFHARVEEVEGRIAIVDLNSRNGVFLRGGSAKVPARLAPQVAVDLAPYHYEFFIGPFLRVVLEQIQLPEGEEPEPKSSGTVLRNRQALDTGPPGAAYASGVRGTSPMPPGLQPGPAAPGSPGLPGSALPNLPSVAPLPPLDGRAAGPSEPPRAAAGWPQAPVGGSSRPQDPWGAQVPPAYGSGAQAMGQPAPAAHSPALAKTGHINLTTEALAVQGLRELAASLVPGPRLETTGDIARLITKIHDTLEVFCRCFIPLRDGYAQFVSSLDLQRASMQRSANRSRSYLAVEMARDPAAVAAALLDWKEHSLDAPKAIENIFADLMVHQVALLDGVMQGVRGLLDELSPENIEKMLDAREGRGPLGLNLGRYKALWETYCERFAELSEEKQAFGHIFGRDFTEAYREYRRRPRNS